MACSAGGIEANRGLNWAAFCVGSFLVNLPSQSRSKRLEERGRCPALNPQDRVEMNLELLLILHNVVGKEEREQAIGSLSILNLTCSTEMTDVVQRVGAVLDEIEHVYWMESESRAYQLCTR